MFGVNFFDTFPSLLLGAIQGFLFGFLLRKAMVSRFDVIVKQLLLKDFTVMKVIFTAIVVGSIGVYAMNAFGLVNIDVSSKTVLVVVIGAAIFGIGMAIVGYCPGTAVAALADGSRDMIYGVLGMLFGAFVFAEAYPIIAKNVTIESASKMTFATVTGLSPWIFIILIAVIAFILFYLIDTKISIKNKTKKK
ncbi:MAG: YeeE/YedE family protein [Parachlamydiales bacterium]|nr:YeeE/YedE family protein [Parachlamydiales bacterium]